MKISTYYRYKDIFEKNYFTIRHMFPLAVPIELCLLGIKNKEQFVKLYYQDTKFIGTIVTESVEQYKRYEVGHNKIVSRIQKITNINLFKYDGVFNAAIKN